MPIVDRERGRARSCPTLRGGRGGNTSSRITLLRLDQRDEQAPPFDMMVEVEHHGVDRRIREGKLHGQLIIRLTTPLEFTEAGEV